MGSIRPTLKRSIGESFDSMVSEFHHRVSIHVPAFHVHFSLPSSSCDLLYGISSPWQNKRPRISESAASRGFQNRPVTMLRHCHVTGGSG
jgi:hypothetical protein